MKMKKGLRNNYRSNMPLFERISKDFRSWSKDRKHRKFHKGELPVIVTWPDFPSKRTTIHKIADHLHFRLTNKAMSSADILLFFHDQTKKEWQIDGWMKHPKRVNEHCKDISKDAVESVHQDLLGYGTFIDPLSFSGTGVMKSDDNAKHDGKYIECPISSTEEGYIYQKVLSNKTEDGQAVDIRVPVIGFKAVLAYHKFKSWDQRFTNEVTHSSLHDLREVFSASEIAHIGQFTEAMGAEFCELDVIRDQGDGKIYIIDVNTTPYGPPAGLNEKDRNKAVELLSAAFQRSFVD
ncbi:MAG: hypothetical protein MK081_11480 [Flavobacteriales bacterium]|nr:hypothetical protein [Flavobacteriales bacterium]